MGKQYKNVAEMINSISDDKSFKESALKTIKERDMSRFLFFLRCQHHLTQKDLAKKLGYTQEIFNRYHHSLICSLIRAIAFPLEVIMLQVYKLEKSTIFTPKLLSLAHKLLTSALKILLLATIHCLI